MISRTRTVKLGGITLPVRVEHAQLAASSRIDALDSRIDTLAISVIVDYMSERPVRPQTMDGVWNYGDIYRDLCMSDVQTITGPLEGILDGVTDKIERTVCDQRLVPVRILVTANRLGLAVGYPQLRRERRYATTACPEILPAETRDVGICDFPLVVQVNHAWCQGSERVEHADNRIETVRLSFGAKALAKSLNTGNLDGLYNYAGLIHALEAQQGYVVDGPMEQLVDHISALLERDAEQMGVSLVNTWVSVTRTGYARCIPSIALTAQGEGNPG